MLAASGFNSSMCLMTFTFSTNSSRLSIATSSTSPGRKAWSLSCATAKAVSHSQRKGWSQASASPRRRAFKSGAVTGAGCRDRPPPATQKRHPAFTVLRQLGRLGRRGRCRQSHTMCILNPFFLSRTEFRGITENHQLFCFDRKDGIGAAIAPCKFHFKSGAIAGHHHRADLATTQQQRTACFEMFSRGVVQQRHHIKGMDLAIHRFKPYNTSPILESLLRGG